MALRLSSRLHANGHDGRKDISQVYYIRVIRCSCLSFLADRKYGRAYATLLRMYCTDENSLDTTKNIIYLD